MLTGVMILFHSWALSATIGSQLQEARDRAFASDYDSAVRIYDSVLESDPEHIEALNGKARVMSWQGEYESAIGLYRKALASAPENLDSITGLADVYAWQKEYAKAIKILKDAHAHHPDNREILIRLGKFYLWDKDRYAAMQYIEKILALNPVDREARELKEQAAALHTYEFYTGYYYLDINTNVDGSNVFAGVKYEPLEKYSVYGQLDYLDRFRKREVKMLGGVSYDVTDRFNLSGEVSLAPDAEIYPRVSGWVELSSPVMNRLALYLNLKASEYKDVHLYAIAFAGEYYLGNWALLSRYTVSESDFDSGGSSTDEAIYVKITYYLSDDDEIYAYYSHGNEAYKVETVDTIGDIRADIYGVGGTYFITPAVGVSAGYEFQKREGGTEYRQIGLEIKYRM